MKNKLRNAIANALIVFVCVSASSAQDSDVYWHTDPSVKSCSMVIDPSLTQSQWRTFVEQVGAISSFKSLSSAEPLGRMKFRVGFDDAFTPVDQHDLAWINTFTHPGADCPLGEKVTYPTLRARMGVTDNMDVGAYWTMAPGANYGMAGGEIKYAFAPESEQLPAAALRGSATILTGVPDFDLHIYSVEVIASKKIAMFTPYLGLRESMAIGIETTSKVNLENENVFLTQGYAGMTYSVWMITIAAEYDVSHVNTLALAAGFNF